jgi:hypothetical protein
MLSQEWMKERRKGIKFVLREVGMKTFISSPKRVIYKYLEHEERGKQHPWLAWSAEVHEHPSNSLNSFPWSKSPH